MSVKISVISEYIYLSPLFISTNNYAGGPIWGLLNEGGREVSGQSSCVGYPLGLWGTPVGVEGYHLAPGGKSSSIQYSLEIS